MAELIIASVLKACAAQKMVEYLNQAFPGLSARSMPMARARYKSYDIYGTGDPALQPILDAYASGFIAGWLARSE